MQHRRMNVETVAAAIAQFQPILPPVLLHAIIAVPNLYVGAVLVAYWPKSGPANLLIVRSALKAELADP